MIAHPQGSLARRITSAAQRPQSPASPASSASKLEFLQECKRKLEDIKAEHKRVLESRVQELKFKRVFLERVEQDTAKRKANLNQVLESPQPRKPLAERITTGRFFDRLSRQ